MDNNMRIYVANVILKEIKSDLQCCSLRFNQPRDSYVEIDITIHGSIYFLQNVFLVTTNQKLSNQSSKRYLFLIVF